jgi:hypothetical protein
MLWITLIIIGLSQGLKIIKEDKIDKNKCLITNSSMNPQGFINWEKYEGENIFVAEREGTANCRTNK